MNSSLKMERRPVRATTPVSVKTSTPLWEDEEEQTVDPESPTLSVSMEQLVDLDQLLAELSVPPAMDLSLDPANSVIKDISHNSTVSHTQVKCTSEESNCQEEDLKPTDENLHTPRQEQELKSPVDNQQIPVDAWCLLDQLESLSSFEEISQDTGLNSNNNNNSVVVEIVAEEKEKPATPVDQAGNIFDVYPPYFTEDMMELPTDFFMNSSIVNDTLQEIMTAPDSADCTVLTNPLVNYILGEKNKRKTINIINKMNNKHLNNNGGGNSSAHVNAEDEEIGGLLNDNEESVRFDNRINYDRNVKSIGKDDRLDYGPMESDLQPELGEASLTVDCEQNDCEMKYEQELDSPFLLPAENSVSLEALLASFQKRNADSATVQHLVSQPITDQHQVSQPITVQQHPTTVQHHTFHLPTVQQWSSFPTVVQERSSTVEQRTSQVTQQQWPTTVEQWTTVPRTVQHQIPTNVDVATSNVEQYNIPIVLEVVNCDVTPTLTVQHSHDQEQIHTIIVDAGDVITEPSPSPSPGPSSSFQLVPPSCRKRSSQSISSVDSYSFDRQTASPSLHRRSNHARKRSVFSVSSFDDERETDSPSDRKMAKFDDDDDDDGKYNSMRRKNNEASRRSRRNRKNKEKEMEEEVKQLEERNSELRSKMECLQGLVSRVKATVIDAITQNKK